MTQAPPQLDHESLLIGGVLDVRARMRKIGDLRTQDFEQPKHVALFETIVAGFGEYGDRMTQLQVVNAICARPDAERVIRLLGGNLNIVAEYADIAEKQFHLTEWHVEKIRTAAERRAMRISLVRAIQRIDNAPDDDGLSTVCGQILGEIAAAMPAGPSEAGNGEGFRSTILRRSELAKLPEVEPLVEGVLSRRTAGVLVGPTQIGKTFVALSFAASIATGRAWLGRTVQQMNVLYVVGEGAYGLDTRLAAWERTWNDGKPVSDDALITSVKPDSLANPKTWQEMTAAARDLQAGFVVLDTFSSLAPDADETKDAARITRHLSDLSMAIDGTSLLVHHPGWGDSTRTRGGYQFEANTDEVLLLSGVSDSDVITLTSKKVKEGPNGRTIMLRRRTAYGSCVVEEAHASETDARVSDRICMVLATFGDTGVTGPKLADELDLTSYFRVAAPDDHPGQNSAFVAASVSGAWSTQSPLKS